MNKIKELCIQKNIEQKELAILVGVSQPTVSDWFNNKKNPRGERLEKLSEILGVSRSVILGYESEAPLQTPPAPDPTTSEGLELLSRLNEDQLDRAIEYMRFLLSQKK